MREKRKGYGDRKGKLKDREGDEERRMRDIEVELERREGGRG